MEKQPNNGINDTTPNWKKTSNMSLKERIAYKVDTSKVLNKKSATIESVKSMILSGRNIDEIFGENEEEKEKALKIMQKFQIVATHIRKNKSGNWVSDEKLVELLKLAQRNPITTISRVKGELTKGKCTNGKIDNIINGIFNGNECTAYYIFKRMENVISFDENYDVKVYEKTKKLTEKKLNNIVATLAKINCMSQLK